jgi:hypothetical protein
LAAAVAVDVEDAIHCGPLELLPQALDRGRRQEGEVGGQERDMVRIVGEERDPGGGRGDRSSAGRVFERGQDMRGQLHRSLADHHHGRRPDHGAQHTVEHAAAGDRQ